MTKKPDTIKFVRQLAAESAQKLGLDLVDVELVRENGKRILRLIADKRGGISLDECSELSQLVDPLVDSQTQIGHDYFEVSSPGLHRPLKTASDYIRYEGEVVELRLYQARDGVKKFQGKLAPCAEGEISIELPDGSLLTFAQKEVALLQRMVRI